MQPISRVLVVLLFLIQTALPSPALPATISLNGAWSFLPDPDGTLDVEKLASAQYVRPTRIPSSWQSQFIDLRDYAGVAWYWRSVNLEPPAPDKVVLLRFGAVDYLAEVYVNGQKAGTHEGGYLPFEFDVTSLVRAGENQIAVRVVDPGTKPNVVEGINYAEIPHGKQNWYVQTSGLWQDVELHIRPCVRLGAVHILAGGDGKFTVEVPIVNPPAEAELKRPSYVGAEIRDANDNVLWKESRGLNPGQARYEFSGRLAAPNLWSPASPALYALHTWLSSGDSLTYPFGFRTFETRDGKLYLNGQPIYLRGALDQDFYPETIYTPPSLDDVKNEMQRAKALGLNLLRCHIKVPDPRYLQAADEVGILVWYETPNWEKLTDNSQRRAAETLRGMVERDWNHPSIVIVSLINESWGANLKEAGDRQWLKQAYQEAKNLVPRWLVVDNSACCDNFHLATDLADFHQYAAIPDYAANFDRLVDDQARRPGWLFSPYGDATPRGDEPLVLSEFGNWGLPRLPEDKPWWFSRDFGGREITRPEGVEKRFADYLGNSLFPDLNALADATQWHEYAALKYEIEALRSHPEIQGYVITEFTDLNWEANGLLDMWRRPKIFADALGKLQQDDLLLARMDSRNLKTGEMAAAEVYFSRYSRDLLPGAQVIWRVEGTALAGTFGVPPLPPGSGAKVGKIEFTVPATTSPSKKLLKIYLVAGGKTISENSLDLFFYAEKLPELPPPVSFHDPAGRLRRLVNEMRARNYLAPTGSEAFPVVIASEFDEEVKNQLRAGGRVILIASERQTLAPGLEIVPRAEGELDGNWISDFLWVRKNQPPFSLIGFDTLAGFETQAVTPPAVIKGIPPENFNDVLAGMFYGWIHSNVGALVQAKSGKGKLLICTFSLATTYGNDPYATYLLDQLVSYAISGFTPAFELPR
jgi:hypothetical protein